MKNSMMPLRFWFRKYDQEFVDCIVNDTEQPIGIDAAINWTLTDILFGEFVASEKTVEIPDFDNNMIRKEGLIHRMRLLLQKERQFYANSVVLRSAQRLCFFSRALSLGQYSAVSQRVFPLVVCLYSTRRNVPISTLSSAGPPLHGR